MERKGRKEGEGMQEGHKQFDRDREQERAPNILGSRLRHFRVTRRHQSRDHSICYMPFLIGGPLEPNLYLQPFSRYPAPTYVNEHTNTLTDKQTNKQTRRMAISTCGRFTKQTKFQAFAENARRRRPIFRNMLGATHSRFFRTT